MKVNLAPEWDQYVQLQLEEGRYRDPDQLMHEALLLLKQRDERRQAKLEDLRREIAIGLEQVERGEYAPLDVEAIKAEGRRRLAERSR